MAHVSMRILKPALYNILRHREFQTQLANSFMNNIVGKVAICWLVWGVKFAVK